MLELKNITKSYYKNKKKIKVLDNVSYKFEKNKVYCIIGKSGAGKTTLIEIIGLLLNSDSGDLIINDKNAFDLNDDEKSIIRNKEIGFIFQGYYLNPLMKAYENVMLPMYLDKSLNNNERKSKALLLLDNLDLNDRENHYPKELSGGEQQRVAIARSLANDPKIILADEPTGALDSDNIKNILMILKNLACEGKCVIIVSHDERVKEYADVILKLENGKLNEVLS